MQVRTLSVDRLLKAEGLAREARIIFASMGRARGVLGPEALAELEPDRERDMARAIGYINTARELLKDAEKDGRAMFLALYVGAVLGEHGGG
jgi:hypothetical protein